MNFQQLEYALLLEKTGSFSRAAKLASLTQSAISQQITKLETELGFILFDRNTKPITATANGARFLSRARVVMLDAQHLRDFAQHIEDEQASVLEIGIIPTLAPYLVPLFIQNLHRQHPHIKLTVKEMMTKDIVEAIIRRELDGGIISTPITSVADFVTIPLFYEKFFLYVSYKHPLFQRKLIDIENIAPEDLWLLNEGNCFSDQVSNMCRLDSKKGLLPDLTYHSNSIEALRRIVEFQGGLTFLPELATLNVAPSQEDMIKRLSGPARAREISFIHLPNPTREQHITDLNTIIRTSLPTSVMRKGEKVVVKTNVVV